MPRPRKKKIVNYRPNVTYFKPRAVPLNLLEEVGITIDELETLRLSNIEKLSQSEAARKMEVHQSTFHRTLLRAREKITDALVNGKAIRIEGGEFIMPRMRRGFAAGPVGSCICPECHHEIPHRRGEPCNSFKCPKCGNNMTRG